MAYKYAPRSGDNSTANLMSQKATSSYAFNGRKPSDFALNQNQAINLYN